MLDMIVKFVLCFTFVLKKAMLLLDIIVDVTQSKVYLFIH